MEGRDEGLERFSPVSEERLLLAIGRAWDHRHPEHTQLLHRSQIAKHLGFVHNGNTTRRLRPQLDELKRQGMIEANRHRGNDFWAPTKKGSRRIAALRRAGDQEPLPESPQHREWRRARSAVNEYLGEVVEVLKADLDAAEAVRRTPIDEFIHSETKAAQIRRMGCRLMWSFGLLATGVYCLFEWKEPTDDERDAASTTRYSDLEPSSLHRRAAR